MRKDTTWTVRLSAAAETDFQEILVWTVRQFGRHQAMQYSRTLGASLRDLSEGPDVVGARARDDISPGLYSLHVARKGRKGRHIVLYRASVSGEEALVDVLRILHDSMDIMTHLAADLTERIKD